MPSPPHSPGRRVAPLTDFQEPAPASAKTASSSGKREQFRTFIGSREIWSVFLPLVDYALLVTTLASISSLWLGEPLSEFFRWEKFLSSNVYLLAILVTIAVANGYHPKEYVRRLGFAAEFVLSTVIGSTIGLFIIYALFPGTLRLTQESRAVLLLGSAAFLVPGVAIRILLARARAALGEKRPFLVIGSPADTWKFSENYHRTGLPNPLVFVDPDNSPSEAGVGTPAELADRPCEGIILTSPFTSLPRAMRDWLLEVQSGNTPVHTLRCFHASVWRQSPVLDMSADWIFDQDFRLAERSYYRVVKRACDLVFSSLLLAATLPLLILVAILVKLDSRGPVFFCQERVGRGQRSFPLFKFRTMFVRDNMGPLYTARNDPRITRIGRILRRLRIDELPQLVNIWRGDMSLIGPRPEWKVLVETYEREIPGYHLRHLVSPGITGWAQLNHPYGESVEDTVEKLKFDLYYIQFYSPVLDLEIVLKTIVSILLLRGR